MAVSEQTHYGICIELVSAKRKQTTTNRERVKMAVPLQVSIHIKLDTLTREEIKQCTYNL